MHKNLDRSFFRFVAIHACYRRTDGQNSHRYTASALHAARQKSVSGDLTTRSIILDMRERL